MRHISSALRLFLWMMILTGFLYPLLITAIAQLAMKEKANGSLISHQGKLAGSLLIAQKFEKSIYFWPRPSANDFNALSSGGSNLSPASAELKKIVDKRREQLAEIHQVPPDAVPRDLLFASGSGLDPHISVAAAYFQVDRIAAARQLSSPEEKQNIFRLIDTHTIHTLWKKPEHAYVNVLELNLLLDEWEIKKEKS